MMGRAHLVISTGLSLSALQLADQEITIPVIVVAVLSSLLPDIDEPNSLLVSRAIPKTVIRTFQLLLLLAAAAVIFLGEAYSPWNYMLAIAAAIITFLPNRTLKNVIMILTGIILIAFGSQISPWNYIGGSLLILVSFLPHRGLTHTIYGLVGWTLILYLTTGDISIWLAGGLSYMLHLLADALTNRGIRILPPFKYVLRFRIMSTGSFRGSLVEYLCMGVTLGVVWLTFFLDKNLFTGG
ncbi:metal-dependent hydrolase (plasmid) [Paenibacillus urinalis]|uniref:Metal-dependent hydrolase n=2 Tax=Paenibacillus TaxID=44249 RepID=A0AAX3N671_9BACL|nr:MULTISPECIES: metal-dependent hydrolase [Paenibacillus]MCM3130579.1 metal-dependent hydrolase [Paenibacillus sp. MER 78]WDH85271.1 metal-dependent hydrolase [Paenibacillus urinalis]WDH95095.1 metal-dependent hydrolase [Paenibacillus urinalis]WDI05260.1 metal-dependent hydrolase [Paenibacillus urinalis]SDX88486.1 inner membrane protein [Paenibacillus sp. PDC88]